MSNLAPIEQVAEGLVDLFGYIVDMNMKSVEYLEGRSNEEVDWDIVRDRIHDFDYSEFKYDVEVSGRSDLINAILGSMGKLVAVYKEQDKAGSLGTLDANSAEGLIYLMNKYVEDIRRMLKVLVNDR